MIKKLLVLTTMALFCSLTADKALAAVPAPPDCKTLLEDPDPNNPTLQLECAVDPIIRVLNISVITAGVIFVVMMGTTSLKLALSQGDPKGLEGAKATFQWLVIGFLIVIGVYLIINIILGILGIDMGIEGLRGQIKDLRIWIRCTGYSPGSMGANKPPECPN